MLQAYAMPIYAGYAFQASSLYLTPANHAFRDLLLMALAIPIIPLASLLSYPFPASKSLLNKHGSGLFSDNSPRVMSAFRIIRVVRGWDPMPVVGWPGITQMISTFLKVQEHVSAWTSHNHKDWPFPQKPQVHARWVRPLWFPDLSQISQDRSHFQQLSRQKNRRKLPMRLLQNQLISLQGHQVFHGISIARLTPPTPRLPIWDQLVVKIRQNHSSIRQQMSGDFCFPSHWSCRGSDCRPPVPALWLS